MVPVEGQVACCLKGFMKMGTDVIRVLGGVIRDKREVTEDETAREGDDLAMVEVGMQGPLVGAGEESACQALGPGGSGHAGGRDSTGGTVFKHEAEALCQLGSVCSCNGLNVKSTVSNFGCSSFSNGCPSKS